MIQPRDSYIGLGARQPVLSLSVSAQSCYKPQSLWRMASTTPDLRLPSQPQSISKKCRLIIFPSTPRVVVNRLLINNRNIYSNWKLTGNYW